MEEMNTELMEAALEWLARNDVSVSASDDVRRLVDDRYFGGWADFASDFLLGCKP